MEDFIDIKYFLLKHKNEDRKVKDTLSDINEYIKNNGCFTVDDVKKVFEQGIHGEENNISSDDTLTERYINDDTLDNFVNYISSVGFFTKQDINNVYDVGKKSVDNKKINSEIIRDLFITHFRQYLIYNYDEVEIYMNNKFLKDESLKNK